MPRTFVERRLDRIPFVADSMRTLPLPLNNIYRYLMFRLRGNVVTTATAPTGLRTDAPFQLIRRIEIVANGNDTIKNIPFILLKKLNTIDWGIEPEWTNVGVTASTTFPFVASSMLPFVFTGAKTRRPHDGALDARELATLDLRVTFGNIADVYNSPAGATITATELETKTGEYETLEEFEAFLNKHTSTEREITATATELQERLPTERVYRRFLLYSEVDGIARNDILNRISLRSGSTVFKDVQGNLLQSEMFLNNRVRTETGVYLIPIISEGKIVESLDTKGMSSIEFIFDVTRQTGTVNRVHILSETVD